MWKKYLFFRVFFAAFSHWCFPADLDVNKDLAPIAQQPSVSAVRAFIHKTFNTLSKPTNSFLCLESNFRDIWPTCWLCTVQMKILSLSKFHLVSLWPIIKKFYSAHPHIHISRKLLWVYNLAVSLSHLSSLMPSSLHPFIYIIIVLFQWMLICNQ